LCVAIKSDIETSHIPVLLLTALGDENNILDGLSIGADEYLIKPFSVKILRANIANLLANRELLRMRYANLDQNSFIIINASFPLAQACTLYIEDNELTR